MIQPFDYYLLLAKFLELLHQGVNQHAATQLIAQFLGWR